MPGSTLLLPAPGRNAPEGPTGDGPPAPHPPPHEQPQALALKRWVRDRVEDGFAPSWISDRGHALDPASRRCRSHLSFPLVETLGGRDDGALAMRLSRLAPLSGLR